MSYSDELNNCHQEAREVAASYPTKYTGLGDWVVEHRVPYFCAATDAFAGCQLVEVRRFPNEAEALKWVTSHRDADFPPDDDFRLIDPNPQPAATPAADTEEIPF